MFSLKLGVRQKILLILLTILMAALTISGWLAYEQEKKGLLQDINQRGSDISRFVSKSLSYSVVGYDYHTIDLLLTEITLTEDVDYAKVINKKGNTMAESGSLDNETKSQMMLFDEKIMLDNEEIGTLTLGLSMQSALDKLENQKYSLIKREALVIILIAIGEFIALSYLIIRPVGIISRSLENQEHKEGKIYGEIPITSNDEFGELAGRFNKLRENLNAANEELQSRIDFANDKLIENNLLLQKQSEELRAMNQELSRLAITDPLTGLYNRRHFEYSLEKEIKVSHRHGETNSLIILDIDHFKQVNDNYGHDVGDKVIKKVAEILNSRLRETDLLCRIGGEEFAAICLRTDKGIALKLAQDLRHTIEQKPIKYDEGELFVTISIGIATIHGKDSDLQPKQLYRFADEALYYSKNNGRNQVNHFEDIKEENV